MRKLLLLFAILLVCAPAGFAQSDYSNWEFFIGYAHERANNGADRLDAEGRAINPNGSTSRVDFVSERIPYNGVIDRSGCQRASQRRAGGKFLRHLRQHRVC